MKVNINNVNLSLLAQEALKKDLELIITKLESKADSPLVPAIIQRQFNNTNVSLLAKKYGYEISRTDSMDFDDRLNEDYIYLQPIKS